MKERIALLIALALGGAAPASAAGNADASPSHPIAVVSMFSKEALPKILAAGAAHKVFRKVPVYIGQYGISKEYADAVHSLPNGRYAPIMTPFKEDHPKRTLTAEETARLHESEKGYEGPIPADLMGYSHEKQRLWGLELGRRLRDRIRAAARNGVRIDTWQFDEVSPTPAGKLTPRGVASRWYISGVLHGLCYGRPWLGDKRMKGLVFIAGPGKFSDLPDSEDARMLLWELDHVALAIMGEEYVKFQGDPKEAARQWARGQLALKAAGGARAKLASRYVATMTPGYKILNDEGEPTFLWGNVDHKPDDWVNEWRDAFAAERARLGVAGLGQYSFSKANTRTAVVRGAIRAVARGIATILKRANPDAAVARAPSAALPAL